MSRAAFELECPKNELTMTPLSAQNYGLSNAPISQGVQGCGRRAVYVATDHGYVLNSNADKGTSGQPSPRPAPQTTGNGTAEQK